MYTFHPRPGRAATVPVLLVHVLVNDFFPNFVVAGNARLPSPRAQASPWFGLTSKQVSLRHTHSGWARPPVDELALQALGRRRKKPVGRRARRSLSNWLQTRGLHGGAEQKEVVRTTSRFKRV